MKLTKSSKKITGSRATTSLPILIERDEDGLYVAECPVLAGCYSQGQTLDEALAHIREAIELVLEEPEQRARLASYNPSESGVYTLTIRL